MEKQLYKTEEWKFDTLYLSEGLLKIGDDNGYNFIDLEGKRLLSNPVENAESFSGGFAKIKDSGKWGMIDKSGKIVIEPKFDGINQIVQGDIGLPNAFAYVEIGDREGIIDHKGNFIIKPIYDEVGHFSEGLATVKIDGMNGYIDSKGKQVIPYRFRDASRFVKGIAPVNLGKGNWDNKWIFINKSGEKVSQPRIHVDMVWAFE